MSFFKKLADLGDDLARDLNKLGLGKDKDKHRDDGPPHRDYQGQ